MHVSEPKLNFEINIKCNNKTELIVHKDRSCKEIQILYYS